MSKTLTPNDIYSAFKAAFQTAKRSYCNDRMYGKQIGNIDAFLPSLRFKDDEIDVRIRACFNVKWAEDTLLGKEEKDRQSIFASVRVTADPLPKGDSDLYDWTMVGALDNATIEEMVKFGTYITTAYNNAQEAIVKYLQEGKKPALLMKVITKKVVEKILSERVQSK